jgi:hypothetical protein
MSKIEKLKPVGSGISALVNAAKAKAREAEETEALSEADEETDRAAQALQGLKVTERAQKAAPKAHKPSGMAENLYRLAEDRDPEAALLRPTILDADRKGITLFVPWSAPAVGSGDPPAVFLTDGRRSFPCVDAENRMADGVNVKVVLSIGTLRRARRE